MNIWPLAATTGIFFGIYNFLIGKTGGKISPIIGAFFLYVVAAAITLGIMVITKQPGEKMLITKGGLLIVIAVGISSAIAEYLYFTTYSKGSAVSSIFPFIAVISFSLAISLGLVINHEQLTIYKLVGIVLGAASIVLLLKT